MKACTRACPFWTERSCFVPPQSLRLDGSSTLELVSFTSFNTGAISASGVDSSSNHVWILLNHLLSAAPIQMTYTFRLSQPAPYFFGSDPRVGDKKTNGDAHSIAVSRSHDVLFSFAPGEKIILTPPDLLAMAGWEWNLNTLLQGGEFSAAVNCYNDVFDLAALNWGGHTPVVPSSERPLCLLSVETLRESSKSTLTDFVTATTAGNTYIRFDTRRGDSYFRLPSLVHLILSLIQCIILLSVPASLSILFATTFLGSLSKILKRAQVEFFFIGFRMPSLGLRLVTETMALANISTGTDSLETAIIEKELHQALTRLVSHPNPEVSHDMAQHIFKTNQKIQCLAKKHDFTGIWWIWWCERLWALRLGQFDLHRPTGSCPRGGGILRPFSSPELLGVVSAARFSSCRAEAKKPGPTGTGATGATESELFTDSAVCLCKCRCKCCNQKASTPVQALKSSFGLAAHWEHGDG